MTSTQTSGRVNGRVPEVLLGADRDATHDALARVEVCVRELRGALRALDAPAGGGCMDLIQRREAGEITEMGLYRLIVKRIESESGSPAARKARKEDLQRDQATREELKPRIQVLAKRLVAGDIDAMAAVAEALGASGPLALPGKRRRP